MLRIIISFENSSALDVAINFGEKVIERKNKKVLYILHFKQLVVINLTSRRPSSFV